MYLRFCWTDIIFYAIHLVAYIVIGMMVIDSRNLTQSFSNEIKQTDKDLKEFMEKSKVCSKQLEVKNTEINAR